MDHHAEEALDVWRADNSINAVSLTLGHNQSALRIMASYVYSEITCLAHAAHVEEASRSKILNRKLFELRWR
jgi:hypothetical protein